MPRISKKKVVEEVIACGKDPIYFLNKYARIQHPVKGLVPFNTYHYQDDVVNAYLKNRYNILLKARQLGLSTITAGYIAWLIIFHRDKNVLIVATKQETAKNVVRTIRNIFKHIPKWLKSVAPMKVDNRFSIELDNGSRVKAVATSSDVGRSESPSLLVVDECAFIESFDDIWTGLGPVISEGGSVILLSTPNGTGNFFHETFVKAKNGENNFNCTLGKYINPDDSEEVYTDRLMWWVHPNHNKAWFENETKGKSKRDIAQEYLCDFLSSGDTFIYHEEIAKIARYVSDPIEQFHANRDMWVWEKPEQGAMYIIPADVSRGDALDYSAFHVLRIDGPTIVQVAEYKGKIRPDQLGLLLMMVSEWYNYATVAPENNSGWSGQTILKMEEANFPYIHYSRRSKPKTKDEWAADPYYASIRNDYLPGYAVTVANRLPMLAKLEEYIRKGDLFINSPRFLDEVKTFVVKRLDSGRERPEAQRGYNDDLIMAMAGGLWVRDEAYVRSYRSDEMTKAMLEGMSRSSNTTNQYADLGYKNPGNIHDRTMVETVRKEQNTMRLRNGDEISLDWLLG